MLLGTHVEDTNVGVDTFLKKLLCGGVAEAAVPVKGMVLGEDRELVKIDNSIAMGCDKCHVWFHLKCLNLKSAAKNWKFLSCSQS